MSARPLPEDEADVVRERLYILLGRLLACPADGGTLDAVRRLEGGQGPVGEGLAALAAAAAETTVRQAAEDYDGLFIGVGRGELVPYASWYRTGFLGEWPLAHLRQDMEELGIARADGIREHEDHIAALCEMMAGLIAGTFGAVVDRSRQAAFFDRHLAPWAPNFFDDLAATRRSPLYAAAGGLGRSVIALDAALLSASGWR